MKSIDYSDKIHQNRQKPYFQNYISTTSYHFYNFLPLSLWNQIKKVTNIYFIIQAVLAFIPQISTISPASAVGPVAFIILFSLCFDWIEDLQRYFRDRRTNNKKSTILIDGSWQNIPNENIQEGDIVLIKNDEEICADIILLSFKSQSAYAYIETSNLDGEKNLKPKIQIFEKFLDENSILEKYPSFEVKYQQNVEFLERFEGTISSRIPHSSEIIETQLTIANFMPRSCQLKNTPQAIGLVVYTGHETKIMKNTKTRRIKQSFVEKEMNLYIFVIILFLLCVLIFVATYSVLTREYSNDFILYFLPQQYSYGVQWIFTVLTYFLIMNTIVPISLIVTLQLAKTIMSFMYLLEKRKDKIEVKIHTMNIHEELGQIEYILSDKTGTLTQNKMILRHFQIMHKTMSFSDSDRKTHEIEFNPFKIRSSDGKTSFEVDNERIAEKLFFLLVNSCHECFAESKDNSDPKHKNVNISEFKHDFDQTVENNLKTNPVFKTGSLQSLESPSSKMDSIPEIMSKQDLIDREFASAEKEDLKKTKPIDHQNFKTNSKNFVIEEASKFIRLKDNIEIQGPSPDEIAILRASKNFCGYIFKGSTISEAVVMDENEIDFEVKLKMINKFDSVRKMMSIVGEIDGKIFVLAKGADSVITSKLKKQKNEWDKNMESIITQKSEEFVEKGLRILFFAVRLLSPSEWQVYSSRIKTANKSGSFQASMRQIAGELESEMTLIGASGIEDKLQENLALTIDQIQKAGIKLWVITGDKLETAQNIAYSSGIFQRNRELVALHSNIDLEKINLSKPQDLIVEGEFFGDLLISKGDNLKKFEEMIINLPNVVFSRTNANQKVEVVKIVKSFKKITLAIGDGANDVNMIQEAHVGIGIYGEEGKQASNASDYSIQKFELLSELLFNHGRLSYVRVSDLILFFFYKNFMFTIPQIIFGFFCDFSGTTVFQSYYISSYNLIFTAFAVAARSLVNKDIYGFGENTRTIEIYSYFSGQKNMNFNSRNFFLWLCGGIIETSLIFFFVYGAYKFNSYDQFHEATFEFVSMFIFAAIVFHQTNKIFYFTNIFLLAQALFYTTGYWIFTIYFLTTDSSQTFGLFRVNASIWASSGYWLSFVFLLYSLMLLSFFYLKVQELFYPTMMNMVNDQVDRGSSENCEEIVKSIREKALKRKRGFFGWFFN